MAWTLIDEATNFTKEQERKIYNMPNNQDAVKLLPLPQGYSIYGNANEGYRICASNGNQFGMIMDSQGDLLPAFAAAMNAPTPREQELEAQNKALWELVGECDKGLAAAILAMNNMQIANTRDDVLWALFSHAVSARAAIQKAKESR